MNRLRKFGAITVKAINHQVFHRKAPCSAQPYCERFHKLGLLLKIENRLIAGNHVNESAFIQAG